MRIRLLAAAAVAAVGCGPTFEFYRSGPPPEMESSAPSAPTMLGGRHVAGAATFAGEAGREPPLSISVTQAFYADDRLNIKVRLQAKTALPSDELLVSVIGLREGQVIETKHERISKLVPYAILGKGESVLVPFELEGRELTEYQVQTAWGEDAKAEPVDKKAEQPVEQSPRALAPTEPPERHIPPQTVSEDIPVITPRAGGGTETSPAASGILELEEVELDKDERDCAEPPCDIHYTIRVRVVNRSPEPLGRVQLAVGFAWSESNALPKPPERGAPKQAREELIDLREVVLQPGQGKKLKVKVDRGVPEVPGGAFLPYIRIVRAEPAGR